MSWATRTISTFTAATIPTEKNKENKALKQAEKVGFDEIEQLLLGVGPKKSDPHENENGSYERFMQMVGAFETRGRQM